MTENLKKVLLLAGLSAGGGGGGGGTSDHSQLTNRGAANQHPMSAISGLQDALAAKADAEDIPDKTSDLTNDSGFITEDDVPTTLSELTDDATHRLVTDAEKTGWNAKYSKPSGGIPKADLASEVQNSLGLADSALQEHQSLAAYRTSADQDVIDAGKVNTSDYAPVAKTSAMTQAVGKGTDGKLYTTPGGGGGEGVDYLTVVDGEICVVYEVEDEE